jgi:LysR family transcriptional activator of nhaA
MLNFNHVYYFHVAGTEGSLARAAERIGVTQPTMSEQIKALERALGVILFERTATGLRLTGEGRAIYVHTTTMFRAADRVLELVGKSTIEHVPNLRIGISAAVSRSIATNFLMPVLSLQDCVPTVQNGDFPSLLQGLRRDDFDLILVESVPPDNARAGLHVADLHRPRLVVVAGPEISAGSDWAALPLIQYAVASAYRWEVDDYLARRGYRPRVAAETDDPLLMLEAAARSRCVAFVPRSIARDAVATGRVRVLDTLDAGSAAVHAVYRDAATAELARRVVTLLVEQATALDR